MQGTTVLCNLLAYMSNCDKVRTGRITISYYLLLSKTKGDPILPNHALGLVDDCVKYPVFTSASKSESTAFKGQTTPDTMAGTSVARSGKT